MARTVAGAAPSRTNRRFLVIAFLLAVVSAVLVYARIAATEDTSGGAPTGNTEMVVVAKAGIGANTVITDSMVELRPVAADNVAPDRLNDVTAVIGRVTKYPIPANQQVVASAVINRARPAEALAEVIPINKRAMSINVSQVSMAGGLVLPGDYIDLVWSCCGSSGVITKTLIKNVQVAAVAQTIVPAAPTSGSEEAPVPSVNVEPLPEAVTLTLLLSPEEAQIVFLAENAGTMRAALRGEGDENTPDSGTAILSDILTPEEVARLPEQLRPEGYRPPR